MVLQLSKMKYATNRSKSSQPLSIACRKKLLTFMSLGMTCVIAPLVLYVIDPVLSIAKYKTRVAPNTLVHEMLQSELEAVHLSTYLFNVTNAERFMAGLDTKMKVEEIGPFTYKELRTNEDLELDIAAGVIRYSPKVKPMFCPEESIGHPKDYNVTLPNIALLAMTSMLSSYPFFTRMGINMLINNVNSQALITMDAESYLWGYDEPLITIGNRFLPGWINFEKMGLLDRLFNKKEDYRLEVGATNKDKFVVKKLNGHRGLKQWGYEEPGKRSKCNTFEDVYEGIAYPPDMTPETPVRIFRNVLCRMLELDFYEHRTMDYGPEALVYRISNRTFQNNPDKDCLCRKGTCIEGISDLSPCFYNLPVGISNAHFLYGGPELFERIEGLSPNEKDHGSEFVIEPKIGAVLTTHFSMQVNIVVGDVSDNDRVNRFSDMIVPIGYFKIVQSELPDSNKADLIKMYVTGPYMVLALQIIFFIVGISLIAYCIRLWYWNWVNEYRNIAFEMPENEKKTSIVDIERFDAEKFDVELPLIKSSS